jgi:hypothetical protein
VQITRQPTIVVSPVGWEEEMAGEAEDEDGYTARALYDYQAAAPDEISFDPDDVITNIVMVTLPFFIYFNLLRSVRFGVRPRKFIISYLNMILE